MIFSFNVLKKENELVRMKIESDQPFQYMSQRPKGTQAAIIIRIQTR